MLSELFLLIDRRILEAFYAPYNFDLQQLLLQWDLQNGSPHNTPWRSYTRQLADMARQSSPVAAQWFTPHPPGGGAPPRPYHAPDYHSSSSSSSFESSSHFKHHPSAWITVAPQTTPPTPPPTPLPTPEPTVIYLYFCC